jgi:hypothetical protein
LIPRDIPAPWTTGPHCPLACDRCPRERRGIPTTERDHQFTQLLADIPQAEWELDTVFADDVLYLEWSAKGGGHAVDRAIDTFIFADGLIRVQTVVYTVRPV